MLIKGKETGCIDVAVFNELDSISSKPFCLIFLNAKRQDLGQSPRPQIPMAVVDCTAAVWSNLL